MGELWGIYYHSRKKYSKLHAAVTLKRKLQRTTMTNGVVTVSRREVVLALESYCIFKSARNSLSAHCDYFCSLFSCQNNAVQQSMNVRR